MWEEGEFSRNMHEHMQESQRYANERSRQEEEHRRNSAPSGSGNATGLGGLILFGIAAYAIYRISKFVEANWTVIITVVGIIVACIILCFILHHTAKRAGLLMFLSIALSVGLIIGAIYTGPRQLDIYYQNIENVIETVNQKIPPGKVLFERIRGK